jgi:hypothetical protein
MAPSNNEQRKTTGMASAIPRELRSEPSQHTAKVIQLVENSGDLFHRNQLKRLRNMPLRLQLRIGGPGNTEEVPELPRIPTFPRSFPSQILLTTLKLDRFI